MKNWRKSRNLKTPSIMWRRQPTRSGSSEHFYRQCRFLIEKKQKYLPLRTGRQRLCTTLSLWLKDFLKNSWLIILFWLKCFYNISTEICTFMSLLTAGSFPLRLPMNYTSFHLLVLTHLTWSSHSAENYFRNLFPERKKCLLQRDVSLKVSAASFTVWHMSQWR